ncbi:MAG: phosphoglycerate dehydrogenase [Dehalococcoidales bacterium]
MKSVLVADSISETGLKMLRQHAQVDVRTGLKPDELAAIIGNYEALLVRSQTQVTAAVIAAGNKLQVIGRAGVGVDNIDIDAATGRGIVVVNAPTGNTISAAEHTIGLIFALARHIPQADASLKSGAWKRSQFMGSEIRGKTLGIIGLGNIGSEVAKRARGLEMSVMAYDPFLSEERAQQLQVELAPLDRLLSEADFITLHVPMTASTKGIISAKELATMKPTARIINTARGGLIDVDALAKAVREKKLTGAAVDVFTEEPITKSILFETEGIIVTPHLGASTTEAQALAAVDVVKQVIDVFKGQTARYAVNAPFISAESLPVLAPYVRVATTLGHLVSQLTDGQMKEVKIVYEGDISNYDTTALKSIVLGGLLEQISEDRVNLVNANLIACQRGISVVEQKEPTCENYTNLLTVEVTTSSGTIAAAATIMRSQTHIVRINNHWIDIVPGGYFLFSDHLDRPGLIGAAGKITGDADINISYMQLSRLKPRGKALMVLALDEPLSQAQQQQLLALPSVYTAKLVKL